MAKNKFYRPILVWLLLAARRFFMLLPYRAGFSFGGTMGKIAFHLLPRDKKKVLAHLRLAFGGEKSEAELLRIGEAVFEHYGQSMAELALIDKILPRLDEFVTASGCEHLERALAAGTGVVGVVGHFGNWEIMGGYLGMKVGPMVVIARKIYYEKYNEILVGLRRKLKMETIYRDASPRAMLGVIRQNKMLAFVVDQDIEVVEGVFVDFFGRPAWTPTAPVRFAMASGAPIISAFILREGIRHRLIVTPPIEISRTGNREEDVRITTQRWVALQEKYIRQYPQFWVWNHKRWKTALKNTQLDLVVNR